MEERPSARVLKILVVDDNRDAATALSTLLKLWGHEVRVSLGGAEALDTAPLFLPDLVFLDIEMPLMHGGKVAETLRQMPQLTRTPIIALSGTHPQDQRLDSFRHLFDDHVQKPYNLQRLEQLLAAHAPAIPESDDPGVL